jgi:cytochrome c peroxidase
MSKPSKAIFALGASALCLALAPQPGAAYEMKPTRADQAWLLPDQPPHPADNKPSAARIELGKMLFFDPRLSRDGNMSCASCHNPVLGWSDALPTAKGFKSMVLGRASPTVVNTGYNTIQMWDGRKASLEDQAIGPMVADVEMNADIANVFKWLNTNPGYRRAFEQAYPGEGVNEKTFAKAIAAYERTVVSNNSPFDRWLKGEAGAMTEQQVRGFRLFQDEKKGNCAACHSAPNFTDNGFHNVGLASYGAGEPDMGRFLIRPLPSLKGAFKTPTLRDIELTAPYFHDGSAKTLREVVEHYAKGGVVKQDLSPNMKKLDLTEQDKNDIVAFLKALTSPHKPVTLPKLPQ